MKTKFLNHYGRRFFSKLVSARIEATVFFIGGIYMALEVMGGRLLAPYYGNTVYVWGSVIGIFLLSLSLGYFFGGKLSDKKPDIDLLSLIIMLTGVMILIIPFTHKYVIAFFQGVPQMFAPLVAITALFFLPSLLLGMVSPFAIKLKARNIREIGKLSGNLYAISTMGSVMGTFITTFVLISLISTSKIFLILSIAIFLVATSLSKRYIVYALVNCCIAIVLMNVFSPTGLTTARITSANSDNVATDSVALGANADSENYRNSKLYVGNNDYVYSDTEPVNVQAESFYGQVQVKDEKNSRVMSIDGGLMSAMDLTDQHKTAEGWEFMEYLELPFVFNPDIKNVLVLGLAGGTLPKSVIRKYNVSVDAVDINETVVELAEQYFNVQTSDNFKIFIDDARMFLANTKDKYDLIVIDVYHVNPDGMVQIPFHLVTQEFYGLAKEHLSDHGLISMNIAGNYNSDFLQSEYLTLSSVFNSIYVFNCLTNTVVVVSEDSFVPINHLKTKAPEKAKFWNQYVKMAIGPEDFILTDEYAPLNTFWNAG